MMKRSICILSLSPPIFKDARVIRQIEHLSPHYDITFVGLGPAPTSCEQFPNVRWIFLNEPPPFKQTAGSGKKQAGSSRKSEQDIPPPSSRFRAFVRYVMQCLPAPIATHGRYFKVRLMRYLTRELVGKIIEKDLVHLLIRGLVGKFVPMVYESWYWGRYARVFDFAIRHKCDSYLANDWVTLPIAIAVATIHQAHVVCDLHEYAPLQFADLLFWRLTDKPAIEYLLRRYGPQADAMLTVTPLIAETYQQQFSLNPTVVLNVPKYQEIQERNPDPEHIRLIHHGGAERRRNLETMIKTIALCHHRYSLHFMLVSKGSDYIQELKEISQRLAPGRVFFHDSVSPEAIVTTIADYDIGFYPLKPINYNYAVALPNKFFDFIMAGLAVCIGPSPAMAEIVKQYRVGWVAPSFDPHDIAEMLNTLTVDEIQAKRRASREAAKTFNAAQEMGKVVRLYQNLFEQTEDETR